MTSTGKNGIVFPMKRIAEDIKNKKFHHVYLLHGEEDYLKYQYRDRLATALNPSGDTMNVTSFTGKNTEPGEVIDLGETLPFLSDKRIIFLEDTGFFKKKCEKLPEYMKTLPDYLYLIFTESEVTSSNRLYKAVKENGCISKFETQTEATLMKWVLSILKREGKKITQGDLELFIKGTGTDMNLIHNELEKLLSYTMDREVIQRGDIEAVCSVQLSDRIFDMLRAVVTKNQDKAMELYYDLLAQRVPAMTILNLLAKEFNRVLQTKEMYLQGRRQKEIADQLKIREYFIKNYIGYGRNYKVEQLRETLEDFVRIEQDVKTGLIKDTVSVEMMIVKYS